MSTDYEVNFLRNNWHCSMLIVGQEASMVDNLNHQVDATKNERVDVGKE